MFFVLLDTPFCTTSDEFDKLHAFAIKDNDDLMPVSLYNIAHVTVLCVELCLSPDAKVRASDSGI